MMRLMLITTTGNLTEQLVQLGLQRPPELTGSAWSAAAWTARRENGAAVLVVSADNVAELQSMLRPLPHYGGRSYVLFAGGRAQSRGVWPVTRGALFRDLASD